MRKHAGRSGALKLLERVRKLETELGILRWRIIENALSGLEVRPSKSKKTTRTRKKRGVG